MTEEQSEQKDVLVSLSGVGYKTGAVIKCRAGV